MAELSGIRGEFDVNFEWQKFELKSYHDKIEVYLKDFFETIQSFKFDEGYIVDYKTNLLRDYKNYLLDEPYRKIDGNLKEIMVARITKEEIIEQLQDVEFEKLKVF